MRKPTYSEIAAHAGVGTATVERVLNGRGNVRATTVKRVLDSARALDWPGRIPEAHRGLIRIEVILVRPETSFYARLANAFRRISETLDRLVHLQLTFVDEASPEKIAARIADSDSRRTALIISTPDHRSIRSSVETCVVSGQPVVQIVTEITPDAPVVEIDNYAVGRMAALMMHRMNPVPGDFIALCHSGSYRAHRERMRGFSDYLGGRPDVSSNFRFVGFTHDFGADAQKVLAMATSMWPDFTGIYNCGGANEGLLDAIRTNGRPVFFVGHELSDAARTGLLDGIVDVIFDQRPEEQARLAVDIALSKLGIVEIEERDPKINFTTITAENL